MTPKYNSITNPYNNFIHTTKGCVSVFTLAHPYLFAYYQELFLPISCYTLLQLHCCKTVFLINPHIRPF